MNGLCASSKIALITRIYILLKSSSIRFKNINKKVNFNFKLYLLFNSVENVVPVLDRDWLFDDADEDAVVGLSPNDIAEQKQKVRVDVHVVQIDTIDRQIFNSLELPQILKIQLQFLFKIP
jgi:hypothetical protein